MSRAYLVGVPGAGKTSLLRSITAGAPFVESPKPLAHVVYLDETGRDVVGMQLGARHPAFGGTDRLSMAVQPKAVSFVMRFADRYPTAAIVAEGDRLATAGFLDHFGGLLVWLDTPADLAADRRARRGSNQNESWIRGRATKVANLVADRPHVRLDGTLTPGELRDQALALVPAFRDLYR